MTEFTSEKLMELKRRLKEHGYSLWSIKHFKKHDRINFGNNKINISMNLRGKLSEFALDALVEACVGKETAK